MFSLWKHTCAKYIWIGQSVTELGALIPSSSTAHCQHEGCGLASCSGLQLLHRLGSTVCGSQDLHAAELQPLVLTCWIGRPM